ncbi:MAG: membrane protein insertase YidC, partial [Endomicrobiia bacterium]
EKVNKINSLIERNISWVSISGKYFIFGIFLDKKIPVYISVDRYNKIIKQVNVNISKPIKDYNFKLLFAPKKVKILEKLNYKLINTIEWGTFAPLSKLFYNILVVFYKIFKNYGVAIIGLTIILQILTFPLMYNSIKSAAKMRQLQPQIQLLQKVYKDDPKRLNMEIMNLYREKKVNPFGGCLPLVLQIPIFWALFTMLRNTYDLRGAEFVLWIKDLSQPDRFVIPGTNFAFPVLVLLMGATMFLQQFVSGGFSDPQQKSLAIMMPVIFTIMFFNFPSGLVLYWFISNIFSVCIQFVVNKSLKK